MAQARPSTPKKIDGSHIDLHAADVRTAVLHLVELAAAFEGRGADVALRRGERTGLLEHHGWTAAEEDDDFAADSRCLAEVVDVLTRHRRRQRLTQRNAILEGLVEQLARLYEWYKYEETATAQDLQARVTTLCGGLRLRVEEVVLDALVVERNTIGLEQVAVAHASNEESEPEAIGIQESGGPVEAAKKALGRLVGLSHSTFAEIRRAAHPFATTRRPFGRWVPRQTRAAYVAWLHEELLTATDNAVLGFDDLHDLGEVAGSGADRVIENLHRRVAEPAVRDAVLDPRRRAAVASMKDAERVQMRARAWDAIEHGALAVATADLPDRVRRLSMALAMAREGRAEDLAENELELEAALVEGAAGVIDAQLQAWVNDQFVSGLDTLSPLA